jgi:ubiquinone/menaquinone biosynthesis C-methylase UbiE
MKRPTEPVQAHLYDSEYFLRHRGGGGEFLASQGKELYDGHRFALELAELRSTDRVLDVGCGCGEVTLNAARYAHSVVGVDYAADAIDLAKEATVGFGKTVADKVAWILSDLDTFEFPKEQFHVVFFLDVIEHLIQEQIDAVLGGIYSSLVSGGRLIVHTWPNRWHRQFTYPLSYYVGKLSGQNRPKDPRTYHERVMHVSEQSPLEIKRNLQRAGFRARVFMRQPGTVEKTIYSKLYRLVHSAPLFKLFFCDQIWTVAVK